jgi:hypothetical protein
MDKPKLTPPSLKPGEAAAINRNLVKQSDAYKKAISAEAKKTQPAPVFGKGKEKKPYMGR